MRPSIIVSLLLCTSSAFAGSSGGGSAPPGRGGDSGRLGQVSSGIGKSVGRDQDTGGGPARTGYDDPDYDCTQPAHGCMYTRYHDGPDVILVDNEGHLVRRIKPPAQEPNREPARFDVFLGVQKVVDSDTSASLALAISDDWFRLAANGSRYWEERMDGAGKLTMTTGSLTLGLPVQQGGGSRAFVEGGVVLLKTANDPVADSSITGGKVGLHLEQRLRTTTLVGDVHGLLFDAGVRAYEARVGVRYGKLEGALRVLDFNVGPALYGPELGVAF